MGVSALVVFDDLDVEALAVIANEAAEQVEKNARKTVEEADRCGQALLLIKDKTPHGKWAAWLGVNFNYSQQTASEYMRIANYGRARSLENINGIREALRMIAEDPETPKRERKASVEVVDPPEKEAKKPPAEKSHGETATNAVSREETRKAAAHRPPENFTPVTPSYEDEDDSKEQEEPEVVPMRLESGFDEVEATERIRSFVHKEMARWPDGRQSEALQVFELYLGDFRDE